ncbi:GntR family transcriptional regulator [Lentisalinibacter orientalis]|uniref:GntR family transcriptional regulator n=1 Tax=Lentisalinibacter orientalis TaxID=2992241 RepID=UPI003869C265
MGVGRQSAFEKSYELIRGRILSGDYPAGTHLTEKEISIDAGVSRTPVREALQRLCAESYVEIRPNQGFFVTHHPIFDDASDTIALREVVETFAITLVASRISESELEELSAINQRLRTYRKTSASLVALSQLCSEFHGKLAVITRSHSVSRIVELLLENPSVLASMAYVETTASEASHTTRLQLIEALQARDSAYAASLISLMIHRTRQAAIADRAPD